jgi:hypothetical protein
VQLLGSGRLQIIFSTLLKCRTRVSGGPQQTFAKVDSGY